MLKKKSLILIFVGIGIISTLVVIVGSENTDFSSILIENNPKSEVKISGFEKNHGFFKESIAGNLEDDLLEFVNGKQSLKITTNGDGEEVIIRKDNILPKIDFDERFLKTWIKISDVKKISGLKISISGDNFDSFKTYWIHKNNTSPSAINFRNNQWNPLTISLTQTDHNAVNISSIDSVSISLADKSTGSVSVWFDELSLGKNYDKGILTFTFDDAPDTQYTNALPILAKYDFSATSYVPTNWIDKSDRLSTDELKELQDVYGWDVSAHTLNHIDLSNSKYEDQFEKELYQSKQFLLDNGFKKGADHFAYPFGTFDNNFSMQLVKKYYKTARGVIGDTETLPVADQYRLRVMYISNFTEPIDVSKRVQDAIENGDWLILVFHGIVESNANDRHATYLMSNFEQIVDDIYSKGIQVMTISEVYNKILNAN